MRNEYSNFNKLKAKEFGNYFIECIDVDSRITIIAPHGGRIEPGTDTIAKAIACQKFNYYGFISKRGKVNGRKSMHITSTNFDEPKALELVGKSEIVVAIHGCKDEQNGTGYGEHIFVGGRDEALKNELIALLKKANLHVSFLEKFAGKDKKNICNRGSTQAGVQFELTRSFRDDGELCKLFIEIVSDVLSKAEKR